MASTQRNSTQLAYLFTTFPKLSERFLQRELEGLAHHTNLRIGIHSMIGGSGDRFESYPLRHFGLRDWLALPYCLLRELLRRPEVFHEMAELNDARLPKSWVNLLEHYLGLAFAIVRAAEFRRERPQRIHAVWATAPASAALLLSRLNDIPFSMGGHAYDLFRHGGDVLLDEKIRAAQFIHTTTAQARDELLRRGAPPEKVVLIRRSAPELESHAQRTGQGSINQNNGAPLRILSVGRLIEKKGYFELLAILHCFAKAGLAFEAKIIGDGPLRKKLEATIQALGLADQVRLTGRMAFESVEAEYQRYADVFFFTGKVAASGDRDGLPNVVIEAMAAQVPVFASRSGSVSEAIIPGETGELLDPDESAAWLQAVRRLRADPEYANRLGRNARAWVEQHCTPETNALALAERLID